MSLSGSSQSTVHGRHDLNTQYFSPSVIATATTPIPVELAPHTYHWSSPDGLRERGRQPSNFPPSSTGILPGLANPNTRAAGTRSQGSSALSAGDAGASQSIKLSNALQNLKRLKNQSTANPVADAHNQQDLAVGNAGGSTSIQTASLRQTASSSMLSPPLPIPLVVNSTVPVAATVDRNDTCSMGFAIDISATEPCGQEPTETPRNKGREGKKKSKEERAKIRAEKDKARVDKKERKEAKEKKRAGKASISATKQEGSTASIVSLSTPFHEECAPSQEPFHIGSQGPLLGAQSTETKPRVGHSNFPESTGLVGAPLAPLSLRIGSSAPILEAPSHLLSKDKTHKRDKPAHGEPVGSSAERKTREHKSKASVPGSGRSKNRKMEENEEHKLTTSSGPPVPPINFSAIMHTAGSQFGLDSPSQRCRPDQTRSTSQPQIVIKQQPVPSLSSQHPPYVLAPSQQSTYASPRSRYTPYTSPPPHHAPYPSSDNSYSRISMSYEPQHRPSLSLRPDTDPWDKPAAKKGLHTYSLLAQEPTVTTEYSHDCDQYSARAMEKTKYVEPEEESHGCCGWFCGGSGREYEEQDSKVKQEKKPKKQRGRDGGGDDDDDDDDDDGCVVM